MKVKAAIAAAAGEPLVIDEIDLEGPKAGECLVRLAATGVCHTDAFTLSGADPEGLFPAVLGHEGAGVVEEVGPGVTSLAVGDHVIPLYTAECRQCKFCLSGKTNLCGAIRETQGKGLMPDGTSRISWRGQKIHHYMGTSTFAQYTVVPQISLAKVRKDAPLEKICLLGCGVTTGIGAVLHTAKCEPGSTVAVFGLGGIGLSVVQGSVLAGCSRIIGVDTNSKKFEQAAQFGATECLNPNELGASIEEAIVELTGLAENLRELLEDELQDKGREKAKAGARAMEKVLAEALAKGRLSLVDLFDENYVPIPGTDPPKFHTRYDTYLDETITGLQDAFLEDGQVVYAVLVDRNGYLPTHNTRYTQPLTGNREQDLVGNRTKRMFDTPIELVAARNKSKENVLVQVYERDTGEKMWDISLPVYVEGRHWGAFRLGYCM